MHLQIGSQLTTSDTITGPGTPSADGFPGPTTQVDPGSLVRLLELLAEDQVPEGGHGPFNLVAAAGSKVETGGEFVFVVEADRHGHGERQEHELALERIIGEFPNSRIRGRIHADLPDRPGALRDFVATHATGGLLVDEILIGVARPGHDHDVANAPLVVPVQLSVVDARTGRR